MIDGFVAVAIAVEQVRRGDEAAPDGIQSQRALDVVGQRQFAFDPRRVRQAEARRRERLFDEDGDFAHTQHVCEAAHQRVEQLRQRRRLRQRAPEILQAGAQGVARAVKPAVGPLVQLVLDGRKQHGDDQHAGDDDDARLPRIQIRR